MMAYTFTESDLTEICNQAKEILVESMAVNGFITDDQCDEINQTYAIVVKRKGWFGKMWDKLHGADENSVQIAVVKCAIATKIPHEEENLDEK